MTRRLPVWMTPRTAGQRSLAARLTPPPGVRAYVTTPQEAWTTVGLAGYIAGPEPPMTMRQTAAAIVSGASITQTIIKLPREYNPRYPNRGYLTSVEFYRNPRGFGVIMVAIYQTPDYRYAIVATNVTNPAQETQDNGRREEADSIPF